MVVRDAVGVIRATDLQLVVQPKVPVEHFAYLAMQSEILPRVEELNVSLGRNEDFYDLLVEAGEAALVFGDELRVEATVPIARDRQLELATVGRSAKRCRGCAAGTNA